MTAIFVLLVVAAFIVINVDARTHRNRYQDGGIDIVDEMSQEQFAKYLQRFFEESGYNVRPLSSSFANSSSMLIDKDNEKQFVYASRSRDGISDDSVKAAITQAASMDTANILVVTNCGLSQSAEKTAQSHNINQWERFQLIRIMGKAKARRIAEEVTKI